MNHDASTKRRLELELQKCDLRVQDKLNGSGENTSFKDAYSKFKKIRRCRTVRLSFRPSVRLFVCLSVCLSVYLSVCLHLIMYVYMQVRLSNSHGADGS
jgi:hypothetical protein